MASGNSRDASLSTVTAHSATINLPSGELVQISGEPGLSSSEFRNAIDSALFKQWLKNLQGPSGLLNQGRMSLKQVHIQGVDMFGRGVGFLKFKADVFDNETGKKVPGIVFARGQSVAVLIILESGGEDYVVLTEQVRVPVGRLILELPAGMLDDDGGDIVGTAVCECGELVVGGRKQIWPAEDGSRRRAREKERERHVVLRDARPVDGRDPIIRPPRCIPPQASTCTLPSCWRWGSHRPSPGPPPSLSTVSSRRCSPTPATSRSISSCRHQSS